MTATILTGKPPGGERVKLAEVLPLSTPLIVQIFPIYACNRTCSFCHFSIPPAAREFVTSQVTMSWLTYINAIDGMKQFPQKVRVLRFVGMGEPLLHPQIAAMVVYARCSGVAEKTEIITNGTLLTPSMSYRLATSGLDRIVVSAQDESLVEKVRYLHSFGKTHVHVKIIDCCLKNPEDEQVFYDTYADACDSMAVEHAGPIYRGTLDNKLLSTAGRTQFNVPASEVRVCPQPFATMQVNPDGNVVPCYSNEYPVILGNANTESLYDIWNGDKLKEFRLKMLDGKSGASTNCAGCQIIGHRMYPEDDIGDYAGKLKEVYK